jgi:hypothetical protein
MNAQGLKQYQQHQQHNENKQLTFDDPILGRVPVIHLTTISNEYQLTPFEPFEVTKELSDLRFKRVGDNVQVFKLSKTQVVND